MISVRYSLTLQIASIGTQRISEEQVHLLQDSFIGVILSGLPHQLQSFLQLTAIHPHHTIHQSMKLQHAATETKCCYGDTAAAIWQPTVIVKHIHRQSTQLNYLCHSKRSPAEAARSQTELAALYKLLPTVVLACIVSQS